MKARAIRKRHELLFRESLLKYTLLTVLASLVIIAVIVVVAFFINGIVN